MRYLGNKESILDKIIELLDRKNLLSSRGEQKARKIFFDAFCGTGTVSNGVKNFFDIVINDNLKFAETFSYGRIIAQNCKFGALKFNPIEFFNSNKITRNGFFSKNYAPSQSSRMYFSDFNAGRIDYFRGQISEWKNANLINADEENYLLGCLLESVSKVANVAGVYGAYLKKWDPRAVKKIVFLPIETTKSENEPKILSSYNSNIADIIEKVDCDILYLDPPYTKNKYTVQYHILETLIKNDEPEIKGITGARDMSFASDAWSKKYFVEVEFEKIIRKTKARHIIFSYSSDGILSVDFIQNVLKRYCKTESIELQKIPYKKYRNTKTFSTNEHFEYIFYAEKKPQNEVVYCCPLNYMGGKSNVIDFIKPHLTGKKILLDIMGGGFNIGANSFGFEKYVYNDTNFIVKDLIQMFKNSDTAPLLKKIDDIIKKYNLTKRGKTEYLAYRKEYNTALKNSKDKNIYLFTLILYGFQQQARFNSNYEFNNPVGESGYSDSIKEKIVSFSSRLKEMNVEFFSKDFSEFKSLIDENTLVYVDPPYLITLGSYNDGKRGFNGWNEETEKRLINFLDEIKNAGCKILVSNILEYKGKTNKFLSDWILKNNVAVENITIRGRKEILAELD